MLQIIVKIENVYGKSTIYPVCELALIFASIAKTTTLTEDTIKFIKALGYIIKIDQGPAEL